MATSTTPTPQSEENCGLNIKVNLYYGLTSITKLLSSFQCNNTIYIY